MGSRRAASVREVIRDDANEVAHDDARAAPLAQDDPPDDAGSRSGSLEEAARKGYAWAQRRLAKLGLAGGVEVRAGDAVPVEPALELTDNDRSFLRWLARAAIRLYVSEQENGGKR